LPVGLALAVCLSLPAQPAVGIWTGKLDTGAISLRIVIRIRQENGMLKAVLESPDQTTQTFDADSVRLDGSNLIIEFKNLNAKFEGRIAADEKSISGSWTQGGAALPLLLAKTDRIVGPNRPQEPKPPFPYDSIEVKFENPAAKAVFAGTLTIPKSAVKPPVVVMVTGSGGQDRDETLLGHKPFWVIADYLSRHGIAVLRYDDRGVAKSTGDRTKATTLDFTDDALCAVRFLKSRKDVNPQKIGIIGHSEGGLICAIAASRSRDVAFIVSMAGTGVPGEDVIVEQSARIAKAMGVEEEKIAKDAAFRKKLFDILTDEIPDDEAKTKAIELAKSNWASLSEPEQKAFGSKEGYAAAVAGPAATAWFREFLVLDPSEFWVKVKVPALILNGENDLQVIADQNVPAIEKCLKEAGSKAYTVKRFPGLNHLFQTSKTGAPAEYGEIEQTIAPEVLETIANWILKITK